MRQTPARVIGRLQLLHAEVVDDSLQIMRVNGVVGVLRGRVDLERPLGSVEALALDGLADGAGVGTAGLLDGLRPEVGAK